MVRNLSVIERNVRCKFYRFKIYQNSNIDTILRKQVNGCCSKIHLSELDYLFGFQFSKNKMNLYTTMKNW